MINFDTNNVTEMYNMFANCISLSSLDLSNFNTVNVTRMFSIFSDCWSLKSLDMSNFNTEKVTDMQSLFRGCTKLRDINISNFNTALVIKNNYMFEGCSSLSAIRAGSAAIPDSIYAQIDNPNLQVYVNDASLAPSNVTNVVVAGLAKNIVLTDTKEGNNNFYCPQAFTAEMVNYTREFSQKTQIRVSRGWESIALPFTIQNITHEKNATLKPFGAEGNGKPFWLRQLGNNGLMRATKIEANVPYLISMPNNNEAYPAEYNQAGKVTFSAENVTIPTTIPVTLSLADSTLSMVPSFQRIGMSADIWAINVGEVRRAYYEGSVFERNYREVHPFEAYTVHKSNVPAPRFIAIMDIGGTTGIETIESDMLNIENWYSLDGRKLQKQPKQKGVYISGKRKVVVK